jgi:putative salt-induced outer membrane protein YdiY
MIRNVFMLTGVCITLLLLCAGMAAADEVRLANGDRLSGEILRAENQVLVLKTSYAGDIRIKQPEVVCIVSQQKLSFLTTSDETMTGWAACPSDGVVQIKDETKDQPVTISLFDIKAVNPKVQSSVTYKGYIVAGGSRADGNTDSRALNTSAQLVIRSKRQRLTLAGAYNYGKTDETLSARNANASIKYDFFATKKLFTYAQTLFERDDVQDLRLRKTFGLGLGYQFIDNERTSFSAEAGPSYYTEDFTQTEDQEYAAGRWSIRFNHELIPDRLIVFHFHEGYYGFEGSGSYYIRSEQGFRIPVAKNFFANFQINFNYNSQPGVGKRKDDTIYIFGLSYKFQR